MNIFCWSYMLSFSCIRNNRLINDDKVSPLALPSFFFTASFSLFEKKGRRDALVSRRLHYWISLTNDRLRPLGSLQPLELALSLPHTHTFASAPCHAATFLTRADPTDPFCLLFIRDLSSFRASLANTAHVRICRQMKIENIAWNEAYSACIYIPCHR